MSHAMTRVAWRAKSKITPGCQLTENGHMGRLKSFYGHVDKFRVADNTPVTWRPLGSNRGQLL